MKKISIGKLIIALAIPLIVGAVSAVLTAKAMNSYGTMNKPPLSPPAWLFPVAWTILYILMGMASFFVYESQVDTRDKSAALTLYAIQLAMNFMWSIIFFNWSMYMIAFIWLVIMWIIVILCALRFFCIDRVAAYLLVPYIAWLTFAGYLNMGAYLLNTNKN